MSSEDAAGAAPEDVAELQRLLAAAQQTAKVSLARANQHAGELTRWRGKRDALAMAVREALGMGPPPKCIHTAPILARAAELRADRDEAVGATGQLRRRVTLLTADLEETRAELAARPAELELELEALRSRMERQSAQLTEERALAKAAEVARRAAESKAAAASHSARVCKASTAVRVASEELRELRAQLAAAKADAGAAKKAAERELDAAKAATERQRDRALREQAAAEQLRCVVAGLRERVAELEARPSPGPMTLSEVEQITAAQRIARSPRVVSALRGADVATLLRSGSPVAVALGRVALGGVGEAMDRAGLVLALAQAWAKGVR